MMNYNDERALPHPRRDEIEKHSKKRKKHHHRSSSSSKKEYEKLKKKKKSIMKSSSISDSHDDRINKKKKKKKYEKRTKEYSSSSSCESSPSETTINRVEPNIQQQLQSPQSLKELVNSMFQIIIPLSTAAQVTRFAQELDQIIHLLLHGNCICLKDIDNSSSSMITSVIPWKDILEKLFLTIGLMYVEMEQEEEEDPHTEPRFGYVVPDESDTSLSRIHSILEKLHIISSCCKDQYTSQQQQQQREDDDEEQQQYMDVVIKNPSDSTCNFTKSTYTNQDMKRVIGPSMKPEDSLSDIQYRMNTSIVNSRIQNANQPVTEEEDETNVVGPVIPWTQEGIQRKNNQSHSYLPISTIHNIKARNNNIPTTTTTTPNTTTNTLLQREEWMTEISKDDNTFLNDIMKMSKNRSFQRGKSSHRASSTTNTMTPQPIVDPKIQQELQDIKQNYIHSRGPSLMEMHQERKRNQQQQQRQQGGGRGGDFQWNREKDLERGRTIDTQRLQKIMGSASTDLKTKFQGDYTKSFT